MKSRSRWLILLPLFGPGELACHRAAAPPAPPELVDVSTTPPAAPVVAATPAGAAPPTVIYGHVRIPDPTGLLAHVRTQLVPTPKQSMLEESQVRMMLGMGLGGRHGVAEHIDLAQPMGCVLVSPKQHEEPMACVAGYQGGVPQLVVDLGAEGFIEGDDTHATYHFGGRPYYFDTMGTSVVVTMAPNVGALAREELEREIVQAPRGAADVSGAFHLAAIFDDAPDVIEALVEEMGRRSQRAATGDPDIDAIQEASGRSQQRQVMSFGELERAEVWLEIQPDRMRWGYRGTALPDTETAKAYAVPSRGGVDRDLLEQLPAESFLVSGFNSDFDAMRRDPVLGGYLDAMANLDATGATTALAEIYRDSFGMWSEVATGQGVVAAFVEPKTLGGIVFAYRLKPGADAKSYLRKLMEQMAEVAEATKTYFRLEVRRDAIKGGKLRGDVVTMRPSAEMQARLEGEAIWDALRKKVGDSPQLHIAFLQVGDVLYLAMTAQRPESYIRRMLMAARGRHNLGQRASVGRLLDQHAADSMLVAVDLAGLRRWLVDTGLVEEPPRPFGNDLDDVVLSMRSPGPNQREVLVDASQGLIDSLRALTP